MRSGLKDLALCDQVAQEVQPLEARLGLSFLPSQESLNVFCTLFLVFHQTCI